MSRKGGSVGVNECVHNVDHVNDGHLGIGVEPLRTEEIAAKV
jgi:hypothetical protein